MDRQELERLREELCEVGRRVWARGFVASNDGNFSVRLDDGTFLSTPTMISKGFMQPDDLVIVDAEGRKVAGRREPTSEIRMHLFLYRHRPDIRSVVHAHPPHATAFCVARRALPKCVLPEIEVFAGEIPMAPYETPGTWKFAETLAPHVASHQVFLLASHGAVAAGSDPLDAYHKLESLEHYCRVLILAAQLGGWTQLDVGAIGELLQIRQKMGLPDRRYHMPPSEWCEPFPAPPAPSAAPSSAGPSRQALREMVAKALREMLGDHRDKEK
jgi:L-fuculose-phosphate aldolase